MRYGSILFYGEVPLSHSAWLQPSPAPTATGGKPTPIPGADAALPRRRASRHPNWPHAGVLGRRGVTPLSPQGTPRRSDPSHSRAARALQLIACVTTWEGRRPSEEYEAQLAQLRPSQTAQQLSARNKQQDCADSQAIGNHQSESPTESHRRRQQERPVCRHRPPALHTTALPTRRDRSPRPPAELPEVAADECVRSQQICNRRERKYCLGLEPRTI
jgi:hypothetical protein